MRKNYVFIAITSLLLLSSSFFTYLSIAQNRNLNIFNFISSLFLVLSLIIFPLLSTETNGLFKLYLWYMIIVAIDATVLMLSSFEIIKIKHVIQIAMSIFISPFNGLSYLNFISDNILPIFTILSLLYVIIFFILLYKRKDKNHEK